jgi:GNAT superfamily N-acetyltransferase
MKLSLKHAIAASLRSAAALLTSGNEPALALLLAPRGKAAAIGEEKGNTVEDGISRYTSPHGSTRYLFRIKGVAVSVLQLVSRDGKNATIANVYTLPEHRRQGLATLLLARAKKDFAQVTHSTSLTPDGAAWSEAVEQT